ncbi:hypothetical protein Tco_1451713 [Tanacetum coccineum]
MIFELLATQKGLMIIWRHIMRLVGRRVWSGGGYGRVISLNSRWWMRSSEEEFNPIDILTYSKELLLGEDATRAIPNMGFNLVDVESVWLSLLGDRVRWEMEDVRQLVVMWECP